MDIAVLKINWRFVVVLSNTIGAIFPTAFAHFVSWCYILLVLRVFQTFKLLLYLLWWSVISYLWYYYCNYFGHHELYPQMMMELINKYVCSDCSTNQPFCHLSPCPPYSLRQNNIETRPINNPTMASKYSRERSRHMSLILNPQLEMIKLSEEDNAESWGRLKARPLAPKLFMQRESSWRKWKALTQGTHRW